MRGMRERVGEGGEKGVGDEREGWDGGTGKGAGVGTCVRVCARAGARRVRA